MPFDPRLRTVVDGHRTTFESLGCIVEQAEPDFAHAEIAFRVLRAWNWANTYGQRLHDHPDAFKDTLKGEIEEGLGLTGMDVAHAETAHGQLWRRFQAFLEKYEYFILPTTQLPPFDVNTPYPTEVAGVKFDNYIDWMKSCWYISATGNPAASVPCGLLFASGSLLFLAELMKCMFVPSSFSHKVWQKCPVLEAGWSAFLQVASAAPRPISSLPDHGGA